MIWVILLHVPLSKLFHRFGGSALLVLCLISWIPERKELFGDSFLLESMLILTAYALYIGRQYKGKFKVMWAPLIFTTLTMIPLWNLVILPTLNALNDGPVYSMVVEIDKVQRTQSKKSFYHWVYVKTPVAQRLFIDRNSFELLENKKKALLFYKKGLFGKSFFVQIEPLEI